MMEPCWPPLDSWSTPDRPVIDARSTVTVMVGSGCIVGGPANGQGACGRRGRGSARVPRAAKAPKTAKNRYRDGFPSQGTDVRSAPRGFRNGRKSEPVPRHQQPGGRGWWHDAKLASPKRCPSTLEEPAWRNVAITWICSRHFKCTPGRTSESLPNKRMGVFWLVSPGWEERWRWEAGRCTQEKGERDSDRGQRKRR